MMLAYQNTETLWSFGSKYGVDVSQIAGARFHALGIALNRCSTIGEAKALRGAL